MILGETRLILRKRESEMHTTDVGRKLYPRLLGKRSYEAAIAKAMSLPYGEAEIMGLARPLSGDLFITCALETPTGPETMTEVSVARLVHQLEPNGRLTIPTCFPCLHCGSAVLIDEKGIGGGCPDLLAHEYEPFIRSWRAFPGSAPGRFRMVLRCENCRAPFAMGGEDLRPKREPKSFLPLIAWTMDAPCRKPWGA